MFRQHVLPIGAATIWIALSEFIRNEVWLKSHWVSHYNALGLTFPSSPANGMIWGLWSLAFALVIRVILLRFALMQAIALAWFAGFVLMWIVVGNMGVLPFGILPFAVPLSVLETAIAALIIHGLTRAQK